MRLLNYIWKATQMKLWNSKFAAFLLIMFVTCVHYMRPMMQMVAAVEYPVTWCLFPFLFSNNVFLALFWFGIVYIHSDIPFLQYFNMYQVIRTGRVRWLLGNAAGIFVRSCAAAVLTAVFCVLPLLGHIELTNEWGKVMNTLAMTDAWTTFGFEFNINYEAFIKYTPLELMGATVLILALVGTFLGMVMLVLALCVNRVVGVGAAIAVCLLSYPAQNVHVMYQASAARFAPALWAKLAAGATQQLGYYQLPPLWYMLVFLAVGLAVCMALSLARVKRMELDWVHEDS